MKHNLLKSIFISLILMMGVGNAWAVDHTGGYVYFLKPSTWTESKVMMFIGHDFYTSVYEMTKVSNTDNLYRYTMPSWGGATYVAFANAGSVWGSGSWGPSNRTNAPHYTNVYNNYGFNIGSYYVIVPSETGKNASITINYTGTTASSVNRTTKAISSNAAAGTVSVSGYYLSSATAVSTRSAVSSTASNTTASTTLAPASTATFKATANTGYEFVGWYDAASGGNQLSTNTTYTVKYDISYTGKTVYARFKANQYTITYKDQGGGEFSGTHASGYPTKHTYGTATTLKDPSKAGYTFDGWFTDAACTNKVTSLGATAYTANITLYAKWTANKYTVTLDPQEGTGGTESVTVHYEADDYSVNPVVAPTRNGYTFGGYYVGASGSGFQVVDENGIWLASAHGYTDTNGKWKRASNITLYAQWTANEYTINWNLNYDGSVDPTTNTYIYDGAELELPTPTRSGYDFLGWFTESEGGEKIENVGGSNKPLADVTYYAHWEENVVNHKVTFGVEAASEAFGKLSAQANSTNITSGDELVHGTSITFTATPETGYEVEGWYTDAACTSGQHDAGSATYTTTVNDALNVYVKFVEKTWSVSFATSTGGSIVEPASTPQTVGQVTGITIIAESAMGYSFAGWTSSNGGSFNDAKAEKTTFYPTAATTVTANFTENLYAITVTSSDNNHGTVSPESGTAGIATQFTITATPVLGYRFVNWTATGGATIADPNSPETTITASAAGTVTANFELIPPTTIYVKSKGQIADFKWNYNSTAYPMDKVDCDGTYYTADILGGIEEITLTGSNSFTTTALTVPTDDKVLYDLTSTNITHLYLKPNSNWKLANARFAAYFFGNSGNAWQSMEADGTSGYYKAAVPAGTWTNVIFCRMNPSSNTNGWTQDTQLWNKTADLQFPTNGNNLYTLTGGEWNAVTGSWSTIWDNSRWTTFEAPKLDVKINITGKGSIVIDGETYTSSTTGKESFAFTKTSGESITIGAITPADRWALTSNQITMCDNTVDLTDSHTINGDASIDLSFTQTSCEVVFDLNLPNGVVTPSWSIDNQYIDINGTAIEPSVGEIGEYLFGGWYKNGSTFTDANKYDFSTPVTGDLTLYARWIPYAQCIFFKNNLKWMNVYVYTFTNNAWWNDNTGVHPATNKLEQGKMTRIGLTDIYYYIHTEQTDFNYIAFSESDMSDSVAICKTNAVYRGDHKNQMPLFIPQTDQTPTTTNQTKYYSSGIWMKYNSTESGYEWRGATSEDANDSGWSNEFKFTTDNPGGYSFKASVKFDNINKHYFKVRNYNNTWFGNGGTMAQDNCTNWIFGDNNNANAKITPTVDGQYTFTIYLGDGNVVVSLDYPLSTNDYRLAYKDDSETTLRGGDYIKKWNEESVHLDTTSFFVRHDKNPQISLQQCTEIRDGEPTWADVEAYDIDGLSSTDVYNFVLKQNNKGSTHSRSVETSLTHLYSGNYYIRTDIAPGGWNTYKQNSHAFTHFNKYDDETYNHYWVGYTEYSNVNTKARIANDYNSNLSTELGDYNISNANVRYSYNNNTNVFNRAFLGGSTVNNDFLKLVVGDNFAEGKTFTDISNWVYEVTVKATKGTKADVSAKHDNVNNKEPYNLRDDVTLLGAGSSEGEQTIRVIYDFKKNRMICGWVPNDTTDHDGNLIIDADMLIVRVGNESAPIIKMDSVEDKISDLNRIYFVMELSKETIINDTTNLFWFSVPFECKLKDVFGIEGYGEKWVIQRYRGDKRAEYGFRPEIETFWANMKQNNTATLEPNRGYVLSLNLTESDFKSIDIDEKGDGNKVTKSLLRLYFPSTAQGFTLSKDNDMIVTVPGHLCTVQSIEDRKPLDSHWNIIGVPGYQPVKVEGYEPIPPAGGYYPGEDAHNANIAPNFLYTWNGTKDGYTVEDGSKFTYQHFYAYMVQFAGTIDWSQYTQNTNPASAPRRMATKADKRYKLLLSENGINADQTFITLSENGSHEYSIGNDLEKIGSTSVARIYTQEGNWNLAANHLCDTTTVLPLTLSIPAEGEYTLSLEQGRYSSDALLYDSETGTYTDLSKEGYTFTAEAGVNNERFALRFGMKLPGGNPTDLQQSQAQYLVRTEGQRIIIEGMAGDVRLYDMTGRVMTQLHANDYTEITVPVTGVYVLQVGNQFEKMIIK